MDTITHTLFGLALYGAVNKERLSRKEKQALFFTAVAGSQIPDIDVISSWWDTAGRYQMWHRGLTHSIFLVPVWGALIALIVRWIWGTKGWLFAGLGTLAVFIHDTSDLFNAWGTGYLEPFSTVRITYGTVPIVDLTFWVIMLAGWLWARSRKKRYGDGRRSYRIYRVVWLLMVLHVAVQSAQGYALYKQASGEYEQVALSADFIPGVFTVIGKSGEQVELKKGSLWTGLQPVERLTSQDGADLDRLFTNNPAAKTLYEWSPFVVIVDDEKQLGLYDPRFYRNGQSFLFESIEKQ
ncbi:metal-dependent hydrolase [Paenibacillus filicis]|uniref:Metal-dependent hydrolase n=1 Tax=Paenibacillus filicis TaxID=669464 RepID=A0ABU9DVG6_9BACL